MSALALVPAPTDWSEHYREAIIRHTAWSRECDADMRGHIAADSYGAADIARQSRDHAAVDAVVALLRWARST